MYTKPGTMVRPRARLRGVTAWGHGSHSGQRYSVPGLGDELAVLCVAANLGPEETHHLLP